MGENESVPTTVRVRTDPEEGLAYRYDIIQKAADELEESKTQAILTSCDLVGRVLPTIEDALAHEDIPPRVAQEITEEISASSRYLDIEYIPASVEIDID